MTLRQGLAGTKYGIPGFRLRCYSSESIGSHLSATTIDEPRRYVAVLRFLQPALELNRPRIKRLELGTSFSREVTNVRIKTLVSKRPIPTVLFTGPYVGATGGTLR